MSAISIFIEIDFEGNTYYLSNSAVTREQVFYPYLTSVPSLSIGGDGYAVVTTGGLSIIRSEDPTHPFSGDRYYIFSIYKIYSQNCQFLVFWSLME